MYTYIGTISFIVVNEYEIIRKFIIDNIGKMTD
jgi:hypothetical protein